MKNTQKPLLSVKNICKSYQLEKQTISILKDLSLTVHKKDHVAIMGASGSGKSTLLTLMAALDKPDSGSVWFNNKDITQFSQNQIATLRKKSFGFIFQSFYLIPSLSVLENIMFPLELLKIPNKEAKKQAQNMIAKVKLEHRENSFPYQLSGGERQRVAIARALIHKPEIIFADEPTGNLDEKNSQKILELLLELQAEFGTALVVVTHEKNIAEKADRILVVENGKIK